MLHQEILPNHARTQLFGVPIDCVTMEEAVERLEHLIQRREPSLVVTADSATVVTAQKDWELMKVLQEAKLVTPDGFGISWAVGRQLGRFVERVSGIDLVDRLCALSAERGYKIFLLGAAPGIAELAAKNLVKKYPGCQIVGTHHGYFREDEGLAIAAKVADKSPDIFFAALGMPRQEKFLYSIQQVIKAPIALGIGGSLDVFSGKTRRAPKVMQRLGVEWLWRLLLDPTKVSKVRKLPGFAIRVLRTRNEDLHQNWG